MCLLLMTDPRYWFSVWIENQKCHCQRDRQCKWIWCGWVWLQLEEFALRSHQSVWQHRLRGSPDGVPAVLSGCSVAPEAWTVLHSPAGLKCIFLLQCRKAFRNAVCASTYGRGCWHSALLDSVRKSMNTFADSKELFNMMKQSCLHLFFC